MFTFSSSNNRCTMLMLADDDDDEAAVLAVAVVWSVDEEETVSSSWRRSCRSPLRRATECSVWFQRVKSGGDGETRAGMNPGCSLSSTTPDKRRTPRSSTKLSPPAPPNDDEDGPAFTTPCPPPPPPSPCIKLSWATSRASCLSLPTSQGASATMSLPLARTSTDLVLGAQTFSNARLRASEGSSVPSVRRAAVTRRRWLGGRGWPGPTSAPTLSIHAQHSRGSGSSLTPKACASIVVPGPSAVANRLLERDDDGTLAAAEGWRKASAKKRWHSRVWSAKGAREKGK
mmetsp:Transcript_75011/g.142168  ORF Transcript_75011/g.142168 Transcript_75011/m.142168 type:complete len:287 (-) Transcript_75011:341-1201(-)